MAAPRVLVTGATSGIGRATAAGLLARGAKVIVHGRDAPRLAAATADLARHHERGERGAVTSLLGDLSSLAAVVTMAREIERDYDRLDAVVCNAAVLPRARRLSADGHELQFAVNHLAHFTLLRELLPMLIEGGRCRIVIVASNAHYRGRIDFDDLEAVRGYQSREVYCATKLMNVLHAAELADRTHGTGVTVNSLHPGVIATSLLAEYTGIGPLVAPLLRLVSGSPEQGARTSIRLALDPDLEGASGGYYRDGLAVAPSPSASDRVARERLFAASEDRIAAAMARAAAS
jgi:retinol dehydrogenase-14